MKRFKNKTTINMFFFLLLLLVSFACDTPKGNSMERNNVNDDSKQKYFFEMDKKTQEDFFKKLNLIRIGDSVQRVKTVLGEPTYDQTGVSKEKGEFRARVLTYYIKILKKDLVNEKYDRSVNLIFNAEDKLVKIESNIEGF